MLMIKPIVNSSLSICIITTLFVLVTPSASAEDLQISEKCINDVLTLTISNSNGPVNNLSTYIYKDTSMEKISDKIVSDDEGKVRINFSDQTVMAKIEHENHEDIVKSLVCDEEFRTQSVEVFSVVDSSVGIIEDTETKLTTVDLGTFYGIAGNGTIPDTIKVYRDNILWKTTTKETGIAPSTSHSEWQIPQTFFFNELPGEYKIVLITDNRETLEFEFIVKQITTSQDDNLETSTGNNQTEQKDEKIINLTLAPLKQIANGVSLENITCKENMLIVFKNTDNSPACVKPATVDKLIERGWMKT